MDEHIRNLWEICIEEMPQGCIITDMKTRNKIVIVSMHDALGLAQSLLEMVKSQIERRRIEIN